jgi:hypothetical protein
MGLPRLAFRQAAGLLTFLGMPEPSLAEVDITAASSGSTREEELEVKMPPRYKVDDILETRIAAQETLERTAILKKLKELEIEDEEYAIEIREGDQRGLLPTSTETPEMDVDLEQSLAAMDAFSETPYHPLDPI